MREQESLIEVETMVSVIESQKKRPITFAEFYQWIQPKGLRGDSRRDEHQQGGITGSPQKLHVTVTHCRHSQPSSPTTAVARWTYYLGSHGGKETGMYF